MAKTDQDDPKYFYVVVLITFALVGFILWQGFFVEEEHVMEPDPQYEIPPQFDFGFLDSHAFRDMDQFRRGDDPMPGSEIENIENPFTQPDFPEDPEVAIWWGSYSFELKPTEEGWKIVTPRELRGRSDNPDLILVEGRQYRFRWHRPEENHLILRKEDGEIMRDLEKESGERTSSFVFTAREELATYEDSNNPEELTGDIVVVDSGLQEDLEGEEAEGSLVLEEISSDLHGAVHEEAETVFLEMSAAERQLEEVSEEVDDETYREISDGIYQMEMQAVNLLEGFLQEQYGEDEVLEELSEIQSSLVELNEDIQELN